MVRVREFAAVAAFIFVASGAGFLASSVHSSVNGLEIASVNDSVALPFVQLDIAPPPKHLVLADADLLNPDAEGEAVAARLRDYVPRELFQYFDLYLYVSKASHGPWAQHMFILHKDGDGNLIYETSFPVSTGRERHEKYFTTTPTGIFQLDRARFHRVHYSREWHGAPMPWAMFLNYTVNGRLTGIAIHSGVGHVRQLGHRASGGCIRLPPGAARLLFKRILREEGGLVPTFAFDSVAERTNTEGQILHDDTGGPVLAPGVRVLLLIQNYPGGPLEVARL